MIRILSLLFMFVTVAAAQVLGPKISAPEKEYDFGVINQGEYALHDFVITNTGDDVLKIGRVRASCGCTAAKPEKSELAPGESTNIHVEFNSRGRRGKQRKYIYVYTNDPKIPEFRLKLTGEIVVNENAAKSKGAILKLEKTQHHFGTIKEGSVVDVDIVLKNLGDKDLEIREVKSSCGCTAVVLSNRVLKPNEEGKLKIEFDSTNYSGTVTRTVTIYSNDSKHPVQVITLFANIQK